ncbi:MAG: hypothetical protein ACOY71_03750 [Gemmatimonadota bacterium]
MMLVRRCILGFVLIAASAVIAAAQAPGAGGLGAGAGVEGPRLIVREVADRSLRDVAVAITDVLSPVILYNPLLMGQLGPDLATFFFAHEYAHIEAGHHRAAWFERRGLPSATIDSELRRQELEADCLAGQRLGSVRRESVLAALEFFRLQGDASFDVQHPSGADRTANLQVCLPEQLSRPPLAPILRGASGRGE